MELAESFQRRHHRNDGSRQDILAAEGISSTDAVITLTNMDEENLIISMYASHIGCQSHHKVNRTEYVEAFKSMGIDTFISPKALCSTDIVRYVRAMQNTTGGSVITLHRMVEGKASAGIRASETTRHLGETLLDIQLKPEILIACITHKGRTIIRGAATCSRPGTPSSSSRRAASHQRPE
ncbi:MAG: NAD-binding protein [Ruthenibacterium lactatiformans]